MPSASVTPASESGGKRHGQAACTGLTNPELHSFIGPFTGTTERSCLSLLESASGTQTLYWNGSSTLTSLWEWSSVPTQIGSVLVVTATGPITSGKLKGADLVQQAVFSVESLDACSRPEGLNHLEDPSTWQFGGL